LFFVFRFVFHKKLSYPAYTKSHKMKEIKKEIFGEKPIVQKLQSNSTKKIVDGIKNKK